MSSSHVLKINKLYRWRRSTRWTSEMGWRWRSSSI